MCVRMSSHKIPLWLKKRVLATLQNGHKYSVRARRWVKCTSGLIKQLVTVSLSLSSWSFGPQKRFFISCSGPAGPCCVRDGEEPVMMIARPMFVFLRCQYAYVWYEHVWLSGAGVLAVQAGACRTCWTRVSQCEKHSQRLPTRRSVTILQYESRSRTGSLI